LGASGRQILNALVRGEQDAGELAELAQRRLRSKIPELRLALEGKVREHHRFLLREFLDEWEVLERRITRIEEEIERQLGPFEWAVALCQTMPGMERVTAANLVAEIGGQHGAVPLGLPPDFLGRLVSGQSRERRQTNLREDPGR
jgi:transposase